MALSTTANFLPLILERLGYDTVTTNLLTVPPPPNLVGFVVLLLVARSSDRERIVSLRAGDVDMSDMNELGTKDPRWKIFCLVYSKA